MQLIEAEGGYKVPIIFAEGGTSNGSRISPFKKGAFIPLTTLQPMTIKYNGSISPAVEVIHETDMLVLLGSLLEF